MNIIEFGIYTEGNDEDIKKLVELGFTKVADYGKPLYKKFFNTVEILAYTKYDHIRFVVSELNPDNEIRKYENLKEFNIKLMFNETKLNEIIENFNQSIDYIEIKTFENHVDNLLNNGLNNEIAHDYYAYGNELTYLRPFDSPYWLFQDEEKPRNLHNYLEKLAELGFEI